MESESPGRARRAWMGLVLLLSLGFGPCPPVDRPGPAACADPTDCRLWEAASLAGVRIGFHDENGAAGTDEAVAHREGNATTNHGVSWQQLQPTPDSVTNSMDHACAFAAEHGLFQIGFHYVWDNLLLDDLASWVADINDPEALRAVLRERVRVIFERCSSLDRIDVLNEPLATFNGVTPFSNHFYQVLGPDYIAELFEIVREEAPEHVELFLNENFVEYSPARADAFLAIVQNLVVNDAPIDAVGLQTHLLIGDPDWELYRDLMEQIAALGLKVFVSELDVPTRPEVPDRFEVQAERYRRVVETCLAVPACDTLIVWGISDANTWLEWFNFLSGPDPRPLLFDEALAPKPAYFAVRDALLRGRGGDHPITGAKLAVTRLWHGRSLVSFHSDDQGVVTPSPDSYNDPSRVDSEPAVVELLRPDGSASVYHVAPGEGWIVGPGHSWLWGEATAGDSTLWLELHEGGGLRLELLGAELSPEQVAFGLSLRITLGSLRLCATFGAETVTHSSAWRVVAEDAARPNGYRCSFDAS